MTTPDATVVAVELSGGRAHATTLENGQYLRPFLLGVEGRHITVALVGTCASLLAGDHLHLHIEVGPGVQLEITEPSGTVAYDARGDQAGWSASVHIATEGTLVWRGAPFVVAGGADVRRRTDLGLDEGAAALMAETLVLGRSAEEGGDMRAQTTARHADRELLVEELDLRCPALRCAPGVLGTSRVLATTILLGVDTPDVAPSHETRLAGPGALARTVAHHAHETDAALRDTWTRWRRHVDQVDQRAPIRGGALDRTGGSYAGV